MTPTLDEDRNPGRLSDEQLNALNREILLQLHEQGIAAPSYTTLQGRYCLRIAIAMSSVVLLTLAGVFLFLNVRELRRT